jgi:branched-chain amino acid transport system substrate-binding protein
MALVRLRRTLAGLALASLSLVHAHAAEPGVSSARILFGQTLGLDSVWKEPYSHYTAGLLACFKQVNTTGGVHGRKIEVKHLEDHYVTEKAVANIHEFGRKNEVFGLVAIGGTGITQAAMPLLEQYRLPTVGSFTGAEATRQFNKYLFFTRTTYTREVEKMIEHLKSVGLSRIAVVYQDNAFGKAGLETAQRQAPKLGVTIAASYPQDPKGGNTGHIVAGIAQEAPQAVLMFIAPQAVAELVQQYKRQAGTSIPQPWVLSVTSPRRLYELLGEDARGIAVTQVMPSPFTAGHRLAREYAEVSVRHDAARALTHEGLEGYLTGKVIVEALRRAGPMPTRANFVSALESFGERLFGDLTVTYGEGDHRGPSFVEVTMIGRRGEVVR